MLTLYPCLGRGRARARAGSIGRDDDQGPPVIIPKGSTCLLPFLALHRTAPGVTDPEAFVPERWLAKEKPSAEEAAEAAALRDSFMPFSLGRRNCVGQAVANAELRLVIAALCRQYEFSVVKLVRAINQVARRVELLVDFPMQEQRKQLNNDEETIKTLKQ